ncbi:MAG TPA: branched-chain amino acid ABC transporter permease [Salinisphaeraceae bacterium]|nr:branched-chain amino acid ABC transporter permease [Salinisphaeraceae bacterium]
MATDLLQLLYYGLVYGAIVALGAIGVSLIFGILRFANFSHGDLMTTGSYVALALVGWLGWPLWAAVAPAAIATGVIAIVLDRLFYRHLRRTAPVILLIASFGSGLILRSIVQIIFGPDNHVYRTGISIPFRWQGLVITPDSLWVLGGAIVMVILVHLFLSHTRMGKSMRAMSDNMDLALVSGIPAERVVMWTWIIGGILAAIGGILLSMDTKLHPTVGYHELLPIFAAAIVGGIGRPYGAILGAFIISLAMQYSTLIISPAYMPAVAFTIMLVVLIIRPSGLFKGTL